MKKSTRAPMLLAAAALLATGLVSCSASSDDAAADEDGVRTLSVATTGNGAPISYLDEDDHLTGYDIEVLRAIDEKLPQFELEFEKVEWEGIFAGLDAGRYAVGAANIAATPEREEKYNSTSPHLRVDYGIVLPESVDASKITGIESLAGQRTYGRAGWNFTKVLEAFNEKQPDDAISIEYNELDGQSQLIAVASGGIDFMFLDRSLYQGIGGDDLGLQFVSIDGEELEAEYGTSVFTTFLVSKQIDDSEQVVEDFDGALRELGADGTLTELSDQFFGKDLSVFEE